MDAQAVLLAKYRPSVIEWAGEQLFRLEDAIAFVGDCRMSRITISGMDFYEIRDEKITELIGCSADFSGMVDQPNSVQRSNDAAAEILRTELPESAQLISFVLHKN